MRYMDEYRRETDARKFVQAIRRATTRPWTIMEICGGQTHTLIRSGIDQLLPDALTLVHGPGCPVCVTPLELIDRAIAIARRPEVIFTSFGDMLRVPGSTTDLLSVKAQGGDVRMVYSPLDALMLAQNPDRRLFAVGFETTAPGNDMWPSCRSSNWGWRTSILLARTRAACDGGDSGHWGCRRRVRKPGAGLPRGGPRLHGHGLSRV